MKNKAVLIIFLGALVSVFNYAYGQSTLKDRLLSDIEKNGKADIDEQIIYTVLNESYGMHDVKGSRIQESPLSSGMRFRIYCDGKRFSRESPEIGEIVRLYLYSLRYGNSPPPRYGDKPAITAAKEIMKRTETECIPELSQPFRSFMNDLQQSGTVYKGSERLKAEQQNIEAKRELTRQEQQRKAAMDSLEAQAARDSRSRIEGFGPYKFGMFPKDVQGIKDAPNACETVYLVTDNGYPAYLGKNCGQLFGKPVNLAFYFAGHNNGGLNMIAVILNDQSNNEIKNTITMLEKNHGRLFYTPTNQTIERFDRRQLTNLVVAAFKEWSVNYMLIRNRNGSISNRIVYSSDGEASQIKDSQGQ